VLVEEGGAEDAAEGVDVEAAEFAVGGHVEQFGGQRFGEETIGAPQTCGVVNSLIYGPCWRCDIGPWLPPLSPPPRRPSPGHAGVCRPQSRLFPAHRVSCECGEGNLGETPSPV
jgi:hypothetical protein